MKYTTDFIEQIIGNSVHDKINQTIASMGSGKTTAIKHISKIVKAVVIMSPFAISRKDYENAGAVYLDDILSCEDNMSIFTYYSSLTRSCLSFAKDYAEKNGLKYSKDAAEVLSVVEYAMEEYSASLQERFGSLLFLLDEFDFTKVPTDMQWLHASSLYTECPANERFSIRMTDVFIKILIVLSKRHKIITLSATGYNWTDTSVKFTDVFNNIILRDVDTNVRFRSLKIGGFVRTNSSTVFQIHRLLDKLNAKSRKTLVYENHMKLLHCRAIKEYCEKNGLRSLFISRYENCTAVTKTLPYDRVDANNPMKPVRNWLDMKKGSHADFVIFDDDTFTQKTLEIGDDRYSDLFDFYDIIVINTSSSRQASLFHTDESRPLVICFTPSATWYSNLTQVPGRFRSGCPDVRIILECENTSELLKEVAAMKRKWNRYQEVVEPLFYKYMDPSEVDIDEEVVFTDTKGMSVGKTVGKAVGKAVGKSVGKSISDETSMQRQVDQAIYDAVIENEYDFDKALEACECVSKEYALKKRLIRKAIAGEFPSWYKRSRKIQSSTGGE